MHLIWLSLCVPVMAFGVWAIPEARDPRIWQFCYSVALVGLLVLIVLDVGRFLYGGGKASESFMRAVFAVVTSTDFPFVAVVIGGLINALITRRQRKPVASSADSSK